MPHMMHLMPSSFVNNIFAGSVSVQKNPNVSHQKPGQKNDSMLTVFLLSFYENDSAVLTENTLFLHDFYGTKKANKVLQMWRVLAFYRIASCLNAAVV